jgi:hypothetical protein
MARPHQPGESEFRSILPEDIDWGQTDRRGQNSAAYVVASTDGRNAVAYRHRLS